jgi:uridine kinase
MPDISVSKINSNIADDKDNFISQCENNYRKQLTEISEQIASVNGRVLVMLAGPSSSGKTTTANILKQDFINKGRHSIVVSLDDFYRDQDESFYFEDGTIDYETVKSIDTDYVDRCLENLIHKGEAMMPYFSFKTKVREGYNKVQVHDDEIIIVEGLHALNPLITDPLKNENMIKLYVSVSSRIYDDTDVLLTKRDMRFIRRMIRDYHFRDSSVEHTFYLWKGVRMGEDRYLFPYSKRADIRIDSIHPYEVCVFKDIAIKLLDHIGSDSIYYPTACELKNKLSQFIPLSENDVPETSLLKEFIG